MALHYQARVVLRMVRNARKGNARKAELARGLREAASIREHIRALRLCP